MPQFGASLTDAARLIIYNRNMFIIQAIGMYNKYEESVVDKFKSNLLLVIFWLNIINYNS
jgi:hypothetical protein